MNMKSARLLLTLFIVIGVVSCSSISSVRVAYQYDPGAEFTSFRSYDWFPVPRNNARYALIVKQIKGAMDRQLAAEGFEMMPGDPQLLIALHGGIQARLDYNEWEYIHETYEAYAETRRLDFMKYTDDMLIFDFIDAKTGQLIYRATVTAFITIEPSPEEIEDKINEAVRQVVDKFRQISFSVSSGDEARN